MDDQRPDREGGARITQFRPQFSLKSLLWLMMLLAFTASAYFVGLRHGIERGHWIGYSRGARETEKQWMAERAESIRNYYELQDRYNRTSNELDQLQGKSGPRAEK